MKTKRSNKAGSAARRLGRESDEPIKKTKGLGAGWMKRGTEISKEEERLAAESERRSEQRKRTGGIDPNRGRLRLSPGESADLVILDDSPDTVAFYEHHLKKDGKWGNFEGCPGEWENCPLCSSGDHKSFVWFLTVLDLRGFEKDDGTVVPYFRRLLPIKTTQSSTYKRVFKAAMKEFGTIRGLVITVERDSSDRSASIGEPVILENGKMYDLMDEDDMIEEFGHASIKAKNGDVLVKKNGLLQPFDYEAIFPKPSARDIAKRWGLGAQAGSDDEYEGLEDDDETPIRSKKRRVVEDDDDDDDEEVKPRSKKKDRRVVDEEENEDEEIDEDEEEEEEEDDTPVKRRPMASKKKKLVVEDEEEDEEEDDEDDDDVPVRRKPTVKSKRKIGRRAPL